MSLTVAPPSVECCHCTVGAGEPLAAAVKETSVFLHTACVAGFVVTTGGVLTVRVAAFEVVVPQLLVRLARNCAALSPAVVLNVYVVEVAPPMLFQVVPPS